MNRRKLPARYTNIASNGEQPFGRVFATASCWSGYTPTVTPELQLFRSAIEQLDAALAASAAASEDALVRDAVLFRYWHALDLIAPLLRTTLRTTFAEPAQAITIGEVLRQARMRGFLLDADRWLAFFATRFDPPEVIDFDRCFEQARSFTIRAKVLLSTVASLQKRDERARHELSEESSSSNQ